ncbi:MAG: hypothetical protein KDC80_08900 [Saprospiraceae bacterium]|nr:hypothetical protein [Saprospiraceae bacterium]
MKTEVLHFVKLDRAMLPLLVTSLFTFQLLTAQEHAAFRGFLWRQSTESVILLQADSAATQDLIGNDFAIDINNGKSVIAIIVQESPVNYFNAKEIGSSKEIHVWVAIQGQRDGEMTPVVGAQHTLETMSWFNVLGATTSSNIIEAFGKAGLSYDRMESLDLNIQENLVNGRIVLNQNTTLAWKSGVKPWSVNLLGVNHDIYNRLPNGDIFCNQVQALVGIKSWRAPGQLEISGDLGLNNILADGKIPALVNAYDPIWIRVNLNVDLAEVVKRK